jgi:hypothetical protein
MGIFDFFRDRSPKTSELPEPGPGRHMVVFGSPGLH